MCDPVYVCVCVCDVQVRAIMTDSAFTIEELEELYVLFKVRENSTFIYLILIIIK